MTVATPNLVEVDTPRIACDGGGVLGHPKVYLEIGEDGSVDCPYCGCRYVLKPEAQTP